MPPGGRGRLNGVCVLIHLLLETDNLTSANKMWISLELEITLNWLLSEKEENLPNIVSFLPPSKSRLDIRKMGSALGPMGRERVTWPYLRESIQLCKLFSGLQDTLLKY